MSSMPYRITVGARTRRATTDRRARAAMGRLMVDETIGTRGEIRCDVELVCVAECTPLGWQVVAGRNAAGVNLGSGH